jgi:hypothetical protein
MHGRAKGKRDLPGRRHKCGGVDVTTGPAGRPASASASRESTRAGARTVGRVHDYSMRYSG